MSIRLLCKRFSPRLFVYRSYAQSLKEYETLYEVLECNPEASKSEIRESWLRLSMQYHPDLNEAEDAKEKFLKIKEAYKILNNDEERSAYNDKIGFHHPDPPPEFKHEWTLQGDKDKMAAKLYYMKWDEKRIKELMYSDKLREVDWTGKTPSERYRILMEEEKRQRELNSEGESLELTPHQMYERTLFIFMLWSMFLIFVYREVIKDEDPEYQKKQIAIKGYKSDVVTSNGTFIDQRVRNLPDLTEIFSTDIVAMRKRRIERLAKLEAESAQSEDIHDSTETEAN